MKILTAGERIKELRQKYKIKQKDLALNIMSASMLGYIEKGIYSLKEEHAEKLCKRLNELIKDEVLIPKELLASKEE